MARRTAKSLQDALRDVRRDVEECARHLDQLKHYEQSLQQMLAYYGSQEEVEGATQASTPDRNGASRPTRAGTQDAKGARNALYDILRAAEGSMHYRDLLEELTRRGIEVIGKDPGNNVRSHLSHDTRFKPVGGGMWTLTSRMGTAAPRPRQEPTKRAVAGERVVGYEPLHGAVATGDDDPPPPDVPPDDWDTPYDWDLGYEMHDSEA